MRKCPFNDCEKLIDPGLFACPRHWHSLTPAQKRDIWSAYDDYRADAIDVDQLQAAQQKVLDAAQAGRLF